MRAGRGRCGDASGGWSAVYSFVTPPDNTNTPFTIAIYGDMVRARLGIVDDVVDVVDVDVDVDVDAGPLQGIVNSQNTANGVNSKSLNHQIDWVYHVGDIR